MSPILIGVDERGKPPVICSGSTFKASILSSSISLLSIIPRIYMKTKKRQYIIKINTFHFWGMVGTKSKRLNKPIIKVHTENLF